MSFIKKKIKINRYIMLEQNMFSYIVWHLFHLLNENPYFILK
jgi:hypothetical protein